MHFLDSAFVLATLVSLVASQAPVAKGCTREQLISARDDFWKAAEAGSEPKLGASVKVALNNKITPLASTPFAKIKSSKFTALFVQAVDTEICEIATFRVAADQVLSTRLKLDSAGAISEVEFLQAIQGDQFFRPSGFPATTPPMFSEKQIAHAPPTIPSQWTPAGGMFDHKAAINKSTCKAMTGEARLWTRKELIYAANSYCDGLKGAPYDSCTFSGKSCPRNENGVTTTQNCGVGMGMFGFTTRGRRWVADTETGVVLGAFYFEYSTAAAANNLFLHEYFKVREGALSYIFAPMKNIPHSQAAAKTFAEETS
ncbi:hypothetical protein BT63DRAFT_246098 [Microthyrium microscopicum]|uniref:DUF8021 domain-containing protein n=1 Tax=Microthyrium microscopicum TaxID=703497 RepID=A0A6A6UBU8_9PEZI|nr:hypothetical protein BT63DRAFT_246098 [Microthyrium microscopicum]